MNVSLVFEIGQWVFIGYFILINIGYISLNILSTLKIFHHKINHSINDLPGADIDIVLPISIIVPAYNESVTIIGSIKALLQLDYQEYEVVVVNDGSKDDTMKILVDEFDLVSVTKAYQEKLRCKTVKSLYKSRKYPNLKVIDKLNGGKADTLNAGINVAKYPLFCAIDADSILQADSLKRAVEPFLIDSSTVVSGGTIRIANGCKISRGFISKVSLPKNILALFQVMEYMRAFLFGRIGWSYFNSMLIISGAFGVFHKATVISIGGYRTDTVGEDMEIIVRLHRELSKRKIAYKIEFSPDPICWTEAPEEIKFLSRQRIRWQQGLAESISMNKSLIFNPRYSRVSFTSLQFFVLFELFGPIIEICGYVLIFFGFATDYISLPVFLIFLLVSVFLGIVLSLLALFLEEISFCVYKDPRDLLILFCVAVLENFGYRQLTSIWRIIGIARWIRGSKSGWGEMSRTSQWE